MKLFSIFTTFAFAAAADHHNGDTKRELQQGLPCFGTYSFLQEGGECSYSFLIQSMQTRIDGRARCIGITAQNELRNLLFLPTEITDDDLESLVNASCQEAKEGLMYDNSLSFSDIMEDNRVQVKEHYDGRSDYNSRRQTSTSTFGSVEDNLATTPGAKIRKIQSTRAQKYPFEWPGELSFGETDEMYKPIANFDTCKYNTAMCCWTQDRQADDDNGNCEQPYDTNCVDSDPADNTDLCYVDMSRAKTSSRVQRGYAVFPQDDDQGEGAIHCHGFAWAEDDYDLTSLYRANNLFYVSLFDHLQARGYVSAVAGAPMCGCLEQMPVVTRSDCTMIENADWRIRFSLSQGYLATEILKSNVAFNTCQANDGNADNLQSYYNTLVDGGKVADNKAGVAEHLVGDGGCAAAIAGIKTKF